MDKVRKEQRKEIVEGDLDAYKTLFVGGSGEKSVLESASERRELVQYILVLLGDLIDGKFCTWELLLLLQELLYRIRSASLTS